MNPSANLRAPRIVATLAAILTTHTHAILDTNANLLSDLWEKQHKNGLLFPPTILATDDEDLDGWTNAQEAAAGTDPFDPNPPDGIVTVTLTPSLTPGAFTLTWPTLVGKNYQLKVSTDLTTWTNLGGPITTTQTTHTIGINTTQPDTTIPPKVFWRVTVSDLDTDGDGLTDAEENTLGTNPNQADSDSDGLDDMIEVLFGTNPIHGDTDFNGINDYDEPVSLRWFGIERTLNYGFTTSQFTQDNYSLTVSKSWLPEQIVTDTFEIPIPFANLDEELAIHAEWPEETTSFGLFSGQKAEGNALIEHEFILNEGFGLYSTLLSARLRQTKSVLRINRPSDKKIEVLSIIQRKRQINQDSQITEYITRDIAIQPGQTESNHLDMTPYFTTGGEMLVAHDEKVEDKQFNLYFEVPEVKSNGAPSLKWKIPDELKIGKMQGGLAIDVSRVGTPQESAYLYLEMDADKFRLVLDDISETAQSVEAFLETTNTNAEYADPGQWITLFKNGKRWESKSQLLVSNVFDDQYSQVGEEEIGADETVTDRTHLAALDSVVNIAKIKIDEDEVTTNRTLHVKPKGVISIDIVNMRQGNIKAVNDIQIANDLKITKETYAQLGIKIQTSDTQIVDVPNGTDIFDAYGVWLSAYRYNHPDGIAYVEYNLTEDMLAVLGAVNKPYNKKIVLIYVKHLTELRAEDGNGLVYGHALMQKHYRDANEAQYNHVVFAGELVNAPLGKFNTTHEISHIAGELDHMSGSNIMSSAAYKSSGNKIQDAKRFSFAQENAIRDHRFYTKIPNE